MFHSHDAQGSEADLAHARSAGVRVAALLLAAASLVVIVFALTACGSGNGPGGDGDNTTTTGANGSILHPTGKNELVLQVTTGGGFVPIEYNLTLVPQFSLYGDGTVIVTGPVIEIYPGPALPNLQTTTIPEEAVQEMLLAAREAGLFDPTFDYGQPGITDVGTTSFVINADGTTYRSDIYALGMEAGTSGLSLEQQQARAVLNDLLGKLVDLTSFDSGEIIWMPYVYSALAVYSEAVDPTPSTDTTDIMPGRLDWPLGDLSALGEEIDRFPGYRRVVISGEDLAILQQKPPLEKANAITLWKSGDREYHLFFRPLLPDETE
jgi:hypothetical protein